MITYKYIFLALILFILFLQTQAQEMITGPQYRNATLQSVDVLSSHLTLLQAQAHYDKMLSNISNTTHFAPVKLFVNDGSVQQGFISRVLLPMGAGFGTVDKFGIYGGFQGDFVKVTGHETAGARTFEAITYFGVAAKGFQVDAGFTKDAGFNLDGNFEFARYSHQLAKDSSRLSSTDKRIVSLYHRSGLYMNMIFAQQWRNGPFYFSEMKTNVQPLKKILPKVFGLPFVELISYTPLSSYYNRYKDYYNESSDLTPASPTRKNFDFAFGSDDILKKGLRPAITIGIRPKVVFKKAELAYNYFNEDKTWIAGARAQMFFKGTAGDFSFETFVTHTFAEEMMTWSLSYSYNSPDNVTFIPLPKLHVIGLQFIFGRRETAKAIIPYAASILSEEKEMKMEIRKKELEEVIETTKVNINIAERAIKDMKEKKMDKGKIDELEKEMEKNKTLLKELEKEMRNIKFQEIKSIIFDK